jgi:hypothetical protein
MHTAAELRPPSGGAYSDREVPAKQWMGKQPVKPVIAGTPSNQNTPLEVCLPLVEHSTRVRCAVRLSYTVQSIKAWIAQQLNGTEKRMSKPKSCTTSRPLSSYVTSNASAVVKHFGKHAGTAKAAATLKNTTAIHSAWPHEVRSFAVVLCMISRSIIVRIRGSHVL